MNYKLMSKIHDVQMFLVPALEIDSFVQKYPYHAIIYLKANKLLELYGGKSYSITSRFIAHRAKGIIKNSDDILVAVLPKNVELRVYNNLEYQIIKYVRWLCGAGFTSLNQNTPATLTIDLAFQDLPNTYQQYCQDIINEFANLLHLLIHEDLSSIKILNITGTTAQIIEISDGCLIMGGTHVYDEQDSFGKTFPTKSAQRQKVVQHNMVMITTKTKSRSGAVSMIKGSPRNGWVETYES